MLASRISRLAVAATAIALLVAAPASADPVDPYAPLVALETPADGAVFWQGQTVHAAYGCAPGELGAAVISCVGDVPLGEPIDTSRVGTWTFTVRAEDYFGPVTTVTHTYTVIDLTPPTVTISTPGEWTVYPLGAAATVSYSCDDGPGGSGVIACIGSLPDGSPLPTDRLGWGSVEVTAFDQAGNHATVQHFYRVVDVTPPTITINEPAAPVGDHIPVYHLNQVVHADYSCQDDGWIALCSGPVPSGSALDTSTLGTHTFVVNALDSARNSASASRSYSVVYDFDGFAPPVAPLPSLTAVKAGEQIPVKFSLHGDFGLGAVDGASWQPISCTSLAGGPDWARANGTLSYSSGPDRYLYLWSTDRSWIGTCARLAVTLNDGTVHSANFRFTK